MNGQMENLPCGFASQSTPRRRWPVKKRVAIRVPYTTALLGLLVLVGLYVISLHSYLLFHNLVEVFSIIIAVSIFVVFWNSRQFVKSGYFLFVAIAYLFVSILDLLHTLAYKGMGVFTGYDANLPTQLWVAARYMQSLTLVIAPFLIDHKVRTSRVFLGYAAGTALIVGAIFFWGLFPDCYVEGVGLTPFKRISEYVISLFFLASIVLLWRKRRAFDQDVLYLMIASIVATIGAELAFTFYVGVYDLSNMLGHFLKVIAFYLAYLAFVQIGLRRPYALLFRELRQNERALRESIETAEALLSAPTDVSILVDTEGIILGANETMAERVGKPLAELVGVNVWDLSSPSVTARRRAVLDRVVRSTAPARFEDEHLGAWYDTVVYPILNEQGKVAKVAIWARDITTHKQAEAQLQASLQEKTVLLREIHHRVKNNLQIISSLLDMQALNVSDPLTLQALQDSQNRVRAMAFVHERLYQSPDLASIDLADYVHDLASHLLGAYAGQVSGITLNVQADDLSLGPDVAIPCGLIINELVSNALKHAFPGDRDKGGQISIAIRAEEDDQLILIVSDDGIGLPPDVAPSDAPSLGLQLVAMLTRQLGGTITLDRSEGTTYRITFSDTTRSSARKAQR